MYSLRNLYIQILRTTFPTNEYETKTFILYYIYSNSLRIIVM